MICLAPVGTISRQWRGSKSSRSVSLGLAITIGGALMGQQFKNGGRNGLNNLCFGPTGYFLVSAFGRSFCPCRIGIPTRPQNTTPGQTRWSLVSMEHHLKHLDLHLALQEHRDILGSDGVDKMEDAFVSLFSFAIKQETSAQFDAMLNLIAFLSMFSFSAIAGSEEQAQRLQREFDNSLNAARRLIWQQWRQ